MECPSSEQHQYKWYFDGCYVWMKARYGWDNGGYHHCDTSSGIGYDVSPAAGDDHPCYELGGYPGGDLGFGDHFQVCPLSHPAGSCSTFRMGEWATASGSTHG